MTYRICYWDIDDRPYAVEAEYETAEEASAHQYRLDRHYMVDTGGGWLTTPETFKYMARRYPDTRLTWRLTFNLLGFAFALIGMWKVLNWLALGLMYLLEPTLGHETAHKVVMLAGIIQTMGCLALFFGLPIWIWKGERALQREEADLRWAEEETRKA